MHRTLFRSLATATVVTGLLLLGNGIAAAQDDNADVEVKLPVNQQIVDAHNTPDGYAISSPGVASGNNIQVPVSVPVNVCGNTINIVGLLNPAHGNACINK